MLKSLLKGCPIKTKVAIFAVCQKIPLKNYENKGTFGSLVKNVGQPWSK